MLGCTQRGPDWAFADGFSRSAAKAAAPLAEVCATRCYGYARDCAPSARDVSWLGWGLGGVPCGFSLLRSRPLARASPPLLQFPSQRPFSLRRKPSRNRSTAETALTVRRATHVSWVACVGGSSTQYPAPCAPRRAPGVTPGSAKANSNRVAACLGLIPNVRQPSCVRPATRAVPMATATLRPRPRSYLRQAPVPRRAHLRQHRAVHEHAVLSGLRQWHDLLQARRLRVSDRLRPRQREEDEATAKALSARRR